MNDKCCALVETSSGFSVCFYIEQPEIMAIGQKMEEICPEAYMNGYNWEAFLCRYLEQEAPELLEGMGSDPEAGMYAAYYGAAPENRQKAQRLLDTIQSLVEEPEQIYKLLKEQGDQIEWD